MLNKNEYEWLDLIAMQAAWHDIIRNDLSMIKQMYRGVFRAAHDSKYRKVRNRTAINLTYSGPIPRQGIHSYSAHRAAEMKLVGRILARYVAGEPVTEEDIHNLWGMTAPLYAKLKVPALKAANDMWEKRANGEWGSPVWGNIERQDPLHCLHCVHVSKEDKTMVAYTQSVDKLMRNIQTRIKPGRYLKKFYPDMSDEEVGMWVHKHEAMNKDHGIEEIGNDDPDAWVDAYSYEVQASDSSVTSCMTGKECVRVYAYPGNDLVLLVVKAELEDDYAVIARAIGNRKKKRFVRAYANREYLSSNAFIKMLEEAGWEEDRGCLGGQKIHAYEDNGKYECPYIDGHHQYVEPYGDYLVIGDEGVAANNTSGYTDGTCTETCDGCGCGLDEDEAYHDDGGDTFCSNCYHDRYVEAKGRNGRWVEADRDDCVCVDDTWYVTHYLSDNDIYMCDLSDDYHHLDDLVRLACGSMAYDGHPDITRLDEESKGEEAVWAHDDDVVTLSDGRKVYCDDADEWQAEINDELWAEALDYFVAWQEDSNMEWCNALDEMMEQLKTELENHFESVKRDPRKWPEIVQGLLDRQGEFDFAKYEAAVTDAVTAGYLPVSVVRQEDARLEAQEIRQELRGEHEECEFSICV